MGEPLDAHWVAVLVYTVKQQQRDPASNMVLGEDWTCGCPLTSTVCPGTHTQQ